MSRVSIDPTLDAVVQFENVTMRIPRRRRRKGAGRRQRLRRIAGEVRREELEVLSNVSFSVQPGESVAIIGPKGPARQALLRLVAGTLRPDDGQVRRSKPIVPMIEVARALQRTYTVRQNIYIVGGLLGMTPDQINQELPRIAEQSGVANMLGRYMNSAPPAVRQKLAWSIAMSVDADAYAIDQTLVVGERSFRQQCWTHVDKLRENGATFLLSSDSPKQFRRFCDRAIYIVDGRIEADTTVPEALAAMRAARKEARANGAGEDPSSEEGAP
jgi:ABC-type polysaccharide/polyol phosphate transport system ATPase subunit